MCVLCANDFCPGCGSCLTAACGVGPGNAPLSDCDYMTAPLRGIQGEIDIARRMAARVGVRPYRVFMVWQQRDSKQEFQDVRRLELMPVDVSDAAPIHGVSWNVTINARRRDGDLLLANISPNQVTEAELLGKHDGEQIPPDWRFYYEVVRGPLCPGDTQRPRQRYTPAGLPEFTGTEWIIRVSAQDNSPAPDGSDTTHATGPLGVSGFDKLRR